MVEVEAIHGSKYTVCFMSKFAVASTELLTTSTSPLRGLFLFGATPEHGSGYISARALRIESHCWSKHVRSVSSLVRSKKTVVGRKELSLVWTWHEAEISSQHHILRTEYFEGHMLVSRNQCLVQETLG